jgi:hypothetical protein
MGGFGFRVGPLTERNEHLGSALGRYQTLRVKTLAIHNGKGLLLLTKLPLIFPSDPLRRRVLHYLQEETGYDFSPALILNATHTHSAPARFWALPYGAGLFGMDEFDPAVLDELAKSIVRVVLSAYRNMVPAKIGFWEILRFDPENKINRDRRDQDDNLYTDLSDPNVYKEGETYHSKDHRLFVMKVTTEDGKPIALLVRFGIHGTVFAQEVYTEDAPGGIEIACEEAFGYPTLFFQGAAGDVSPAGDDRGRSGTQQIEAIGRRTAQVIGKFWDSIPLKSEGEIRVAHLWEKIDRNRLGYKENEFGKIVNGSFQPYRYGAFQCGEFSANPPPDSGNPETTLQDGYLGCIELTDLQGVLNGKKEAYELPIGELSRTVQSAFQIGDHYFVTFPGEPVSQLMTQMLQEGEKEGFSPLVVFGYSQTHLFYLTPKENWFQGGYESAMNIWGWKLGEFLLKRNLTLLKKLKENPGPPFFLGDPIEPLPREKERRTQTIKELSSPPQFLSLSPLELPRLTIQEGSFLGGDSWVDPAEIFLVPEGTSQPYRRSSGFGFLITGEDREGGTIYQFRFEPGLDIPPGRYRWEVRGTYFAQGAVHPYTITSPVFTIKGGPNLTVTYTTSSSRIFLFPSFRPHPVVHLPVAKDLMERYQISGYRLISPEVGPDEPAPILSGTITVRGIYFPGDSSFTETIPYSSTCSCFPLSFPSGVTGLLIPRESLSFEGETNGTSLTILIP